jgi:hypothetical protein
LGKPRATTQSKFDPDKDRHQTIRKAFHEAQQQEDFPDGPVERFEIVCHASGEVTWRAWTPRADEPEAGYLPEAAF